MGDMVTITHEACPECASVEVKPYWWHRGQAWIIICDECKHEEGRESSEWQAWEVWDTAARKAWAERGAVTEGGGTPSPEPEEVPTAVARPAPLRTYWHCAWSSHRRYDRESGRKVVSTGTTLGDLYEDMAAKRIAHLHDEDSISEVVVGEKPSGETVFCYGPVRLMAVEEERTFDMSAIEASAAWTDFHARLEAHERQRAELRASLQAERDSRAEERERAEYERLRAKFGTGDDA